MPKPMLELDNVHTYYDHIHALKGISMTVNEGEIVALIGGNGAGKTTTLRTISGMMKPRSGSLTFEGQNIAGIPAHHILNKGISHVPEGRRIFKDMTVRENLDVGAYSVTDRALMVNPRLLLLDEPSMGLSPLFVEAIFDIIVKLNQERGTTVLLVEQNANMALQIAHRAYVLQTGEIKLSGNSADIAQDESVRKAYLGDE